jgi:hypothetical protein
MPTIKRTTSLAANESANPLAGSQYEYLPFDALVQAAVLADAAGEVEATFFSGTDVILEGAPLDTLAVATPIQFPDDYDIQDVAAQGERLGLTIREVGGNVGPTVVRTVVRITPL